MDHQDETMTDAGLLGPDLSVTQTPAQEASTLDAEPAPEQPHDSDTEDQAEEIDAEPVEPRNENNNARRYRRQQCSVCKRWLCVGMSGWCNVNLRKNGPLTDQCTHEETICKLCCMDAFAQQVEDGAAYPKCPYEDCAGIISQERFLRLLSWDCHDGVRVKLLQNEIDYEFRHNPNLRYCTNCRETWEDPSCDDKMPLLYCGSEVCRHTDCQNCGGKCDQDTLCIGTYPDGMPGHLPRDPTDHEIAMEIASEDWKAKNTKPCSGCGIPIPKIPGCGSIRCTIDNYLTGVEKKDLKGPRRPGVGHFVRREEDKSDAEKEYEAKAAIANRNLCHTYQCYSCTEFMRRVSRTGHKSGCPLADIWRDAQGYYHIYSNIVDEELMDLSFYEILRNIRNAYTAHLVSDIGKCRRLPYYYRDITARERLKRWLPDMVDLFKGREVIDRQGDQEEPTALMARQRWGVDFLLPAPNSDEMDEDEDGAMTMDDNEPDDEPFVAGESGAAQDTAMPLADHPNAQLGAPDAGIEDIDEDLYTPPTPELIATQATSSAPPLDHDHTTDIATETTEVDQGHAERQLLLEPAEETQLHPWEDAHRVHSPEVEMAT